MLQRRIQSYRKAAHLRNRRQLRFAPYPVEIYESLLKNLAARRRLRIVGFPDAGRQSEVALYLRHDVDTLSCTRRLDLMLEVNVRLGTPVSAFIRTDGQDYDPALVLDAFARFSGIPIVKFGLHTSCYAAPAPFTALNADLRAYERTFGVSPQFITFHGLGDAYANQRAAFAAQLRPRMSEFGLTFTDAWEEARVYDYVMQDCHPDPNRDERFLFDEFLHPPTFLGPGRNYLVLTHPCYWKD